MPENLFIYGTLHPNLAPSEIRETVQKLKPVGPGTVRGTLYNLGDYPGLVLGGTAPRPITGQIFRLPEDSSTLSKLDDYEEFSPTDPENSLFKRLKTLVTLSDGSKKRCWIYVYNVELDSHAVAS